MEANKTIQELKELLEGNEEEVECIVCLNVVPKDVCEGKPGHYICPMCVAKNHEEEIGLADLERPLGDKFDVSLDDHEE